MICYLFSRAEIVAPLCQSAGVLTCNGVPGLKACGISDTTVDKTELQINETLTDQELPAIYLRHFLVLVLKLIQSQKLLKLYQLVSQENGRKLSHIEIQQLSRRSRKKGGVAIDDEAIRIEVVDCLLQDKHEGTQPLEGHEEAFRYASGLVINRFYRYPSESVFSHEPPVNFTASVGFSVANIYNGFEPVQ
ncbi:hypothetical protein ZIOFF_071243 [Zingiber officinale]|uniref:Uncharacterized protein n=1 Tax=Zingiber officinale TaxID=94328 RepID=A0A8J5BE17_ZINOF|nr:hypothetical protein ZIOFF_071243 [Zingiber officinale]